MSFAPAMFRPVRRSLLALLPCLLIALSILVSQAAPQSSAGSLDLTFASGAGANASVEAVALQGDGKIVIGGYFTTVNDVSRNHIARLNADGTLDTTFTPTGGADYAVLAVALQADGKIVIGGDFTTVNGVSRNHIARLNANGSLDTTFVPPGGMDRFVASLALQPDGKILAGGWFTRVNGVSRNAIARLNADGSLDTTFVPPGGEDSGVEAVALQADGKIVIGGSFSEVNGMNRRGIARLHADGTLDPLFDAAGRTATNIFAMAVQPDGKIMIGGDFTSLQSEIRDNVARLNPDGRFDPTFAPPGGANSEVYAVAVQPNGQILIGGYFYEVNGVPRSGIAQLHADGSLDTTFAVSVDADRFVSSIVLQPDGKILIGGAFTTVNGVIRNGIARLHPTFVAPRLFLNPVTAP